MRISLTGSEGFIGRNTTNHLRNIGYEVRTLDRTMEDLTLPDTLKGFVSDASVVIHMAGKNRAPDSDLYVANTVSTLGLLEACSAFCTKECKVLFASSMQVYEPTSLPRRIDEERQVSRRFAFSNSKLLAEDVLRKWSETKQINSVAMRLSNVYGPGCKPNYNSVIATFIDRAMRGENLEVFGGSKARDFIYIDDVVEAVTKLVESEIKGFEVLNICTGIPTTINEVVFRLKDRFPQISITAYDDQEVEAHIVGDPTKAAKMYGIRSKVSIDEGLRKTLERAE